MKERIEHLEQILEAAIMAAGEPMPVEKMQLMFAQGYSPSVKEIREALSQLAERMQDRGVELVEVASGYRFQAKQEYARWLQHLWREKPPRYSRALLETLSLVIYRQPITRGEIEDVRGVAVSTNIMKVLLERDWVKIVGHRDVPGKPALYATTKAFLDYFNLKKLSDLPPLKDVVDLEELEKKMGAQLDLNIDDKQKTAVLEVEQEQIASPLNVVTNTMAQQPEITGESELIEDEEILPVGV